MVNGHAQTPGVWLGFCRTRSSPDALGSGAPVRKYCDFSSCLGYINVISVGYVCKSSQPNEHNTTAVLSLVRDPSHRILFHYTPKDASCMNQAEIWLSILGRKLRRRGSCRSVIDLQQKVMDFIGYYNRTMAKPLKWTYRGRCRSLEQPGYLRQRVLAIKRECLVTVWI